jgi:hypothetical protein
MTHASPDTDLSTQIHQDLSAFLPHVLKHATDSYLDFVITNEPVSTQKNIDVADATDKPAKNTTKEFADFHAACKAAAGHIELLVRLAARVDAQKDKSAQPSSPEILTSLSHARKDVATYIESEGEESETS